MLDGSIKHWQGVPSGLNLQIQSRENGSREQMQAVDIDSNLHKQSELVELVAQAHFLLSGSVTHKHAAESGLVMHIHSSLLGFVLQTHSLLKGDLAQIHSVLSVFLEQIHSVLLGFVAH